MMKLVLLFVLLKCYVGSSIEGCRFCYTNQPVQSLDCDPHGILGISTNCTIHGPAAIWLKIKWFFSEEHSSSAQEIVNGSNHIVQESRTNIGPNTLQIQSKLSILSFSIGQYWCQVFYESKGLLPSQHLEIMDEGDSRLDSCENNEPYVVSLNKCDNIVENGASSACPVVLPSSSSAAASYFVFSSTTSVVVAASMSMSQLMSTDTAASVDTLYSSYLYESFSFQPTAIQSLTVTTSFRLVPIPTKLSIRQDSFHLWLYIVAALTVVFAVLIIILTGICIGLCVTKPKRRLSMRTRQMQQESCPRTESAEFNENLSRPQTSMTIQTEIPMTPLPPELDNNSSLYDALEFDQDYEDLDDTDKDFITAVQRIHPRYHEQGPSVGSQSHPPLQPTYSEIGEVSTDTLDNHMFGMSNLSTGYGKLDHSHPRQNYYPKKDSPLLSGYRKLEHVQARFRATTLPNNPQPGYANIEIPGAIGGHLRSISLPNSEYSNLNPSPCSTEPNTPSHEQPRKQYANFEIIEGMEEIDHSPVMRQASDDYHMLADATVEQQNYIQGEYEFLPTCSDERAVRSPDDLRLFLERDLDKISHHRVLASLGKDPLGEQISVASSTDFTGPFFFPHMVDFEPTSPDPERHMYRPLDISKMEPEQSYAIVKIKKMKSK